MCLNFYRYFEDSALSDDECLSHEASISANDINLQQNNQMFDNLSKPSPSEDESNSDSKHVSTSYRNNLSTENDYKKTSTSSTHDKTYTEGSSKDDAISPITMDKRSISVETSKATNYLNISPVKIMKGKHRANHNGSVTLSTSLKRAATSKQHPASSSSIARGSKSRQLISDHRIGMEMSPTMDTLKLAADFTMVRSKHSDDDTKRITTIFENVDPFASTNKVML